MKYSTTKYIGIIVELNSSLEYLEAKVDIGGGYYEINKDININKLIAGTVYFFLIKISFLQKMEMSFINDINNNPFTYVMIYEKKNKENNEFLKYYNQTLINKRESINAIEYFTYIIDNIETNYILVEIKPNINLEAIIIKNKITNSDYSLYNGESKIINKITKNVPYYFSIIANQYQQININLKLNYLLDNPFEFIEIYEFPNRFEYKSHNKYTNKATNFIRENNNILTTSISYMVDSFYTKFIIIKIKPKFDFENLNIRIIVDGGYYDINKGETKYINNLIPKYSYYFFVISSKGEKLNYKLSINSNDTENYFESLNVYEYSNKNSPLVYLQNTNAEFNLDKIGDKLITYVSYQAKNNLTNFVALKIIPNHNLSSVECLIEKEIENENNSSFSTVKILTIVLIVIIIFTGIIFIIYIKKTLMKSSINSSDYFFQNNNKNQRNKDEKKVELKLLPDTDFSIN